MIVRGNTMLITYNREVTSALFCDFLIAPAFITMDIFHASVEDVSTARNRSFRTGVEIGALRSRHGWSL